MSDTTPLWVTVLTAVGVGSLGAVIVTAVSDRLTKRREELFTMARQKMDVKRRRSYTTS